VPASGRRVDRGAAVTAAVAAVAVTGCWRRSVSGVGVAAVARVGAMPATVCCGVAAPRSNGAAAR